MAKLKLEIKNDFGDFVKFFACGVKDVDDKPYDTDVLHFRILQLAKNLEKGIKRLSSSRMDSITNTSSKITENERSGIGELITDGAKRSLTPEMLDDAMDKMWEEGI